MKRSSQREVQITQRRYHFAQLNESIAIMAKASSDGAAARLEQIRAQERREELQLASYERIAQMFVGVLPMLMGQNPRVAPPPPPQQERLKPALPPGWDAYWSQSKQRWWYQPPNAGYVLFLLIAIVHDSTPQWELPAPATPPSPRPRHSLNRPPTPPDGIPAPMPPPQLLPVPGSGMPMPVSFGPSCVICTIDIDAFHEGEALVPCGHTFHASTDFLRCHRIMAGCVRQFAERGVTKCPMCRKPFQTRYRQVIEDK